MCDQRIDLRVSSSRDIFNKLIRRANGGTAVRSTAAPALASQFVKSSQDNVAAPGREGAFAEIVFPSLNDVKQKLERKHGISYDSLLGYASTQDADAYPAGFGERSARALAREESTYQLKGSFPAASINFSKLRARVEARGGDISVVEEMFAKMWGIDVMQAQMIPKLHLDGNEATRMSAMEDRAYHSLSGHPGHIGGFRVNTATLTSDAVGSNVPLNWPRLRTSLKMIAQLQIGADMQLAAATRTVSELQPVKMRMDITMGSQPIYERPYPWESMVAELLKLRQPSASMIVTIPSSLECQLISVLQPHIQDQVLSNMKRTADLVAKSAASSYDRTRQIMLEHDKERALITQHIEEEYDLLESSAMSSSYNVPRYVVTRDTFNKGVTRSHSKDSQIPDMTTQAAASYRLNFDEFRAAHMNMPLSVAGALNLASYITTTSLMSKPFIHMLIRLVPDPRDGYHSKLSVRLRRQKLYEHANIRALGSYLLSEVFISNLGMLLSNLVITSQLDETSIKMEIWSYLSSRSLERRLCPCEGSWQDLITDLRTMPEGWTLYYWMRVTAGRRQHATSSGIFAPIAAGESVDLRTLFRRGFDERKQMWAAYYTSEYKLIESSLAKMVPNPDIDLSYLDNSMMNTNVYVPPHVRRMIALEEGAVNDSRASTRKSKEDYERMVEMQTKAKVFSSLKIFSTGTRICVGLPDDVMCEMLTEFYKARWLSLETRIQKAQAVGKVFKLGGAELKEHPWGALCEELPTDLEGMMSFVMSLREIGWTVPPNTLQQKIKIALSELWKDLFSELDTIIQYIEEVHSGEMEIQDLLDADLDASTHMHTHTHTLSTSGSVVQAEPIVLPAKGYVPPYILPSKTTNIQQQVGKTLLTTSIDVDAGALVATHLPSGAAHGCPPLVDEDELSDGAVMMTEVPPTHTDLARVIGAYHTYRAIWEILEMPEVSDTKMRLAFGLPSDAMLDSEHVEPSYGPPVLLGEERNALRRWGTKRVMMMHRCGYTNIDVQLEDM